MLYLNKINKEGYDILKKSGLKTFIKATLITFGLLSLLCGLINPLTCYFGSETTYVIDNTTNEQISDDLYLTKADYHYFAGGKEYSGTFSVKGAYDELLPFSLNTLRYLPFYPEYGVVTTGYFIPIKSIILFSAGLVAFVAGLIIKNKKTIKAKKEVSPLTPLYLCPACECEIDKDSIFCNYCGRKILKKG